MNKESMEAFNIIKIPDFTDSRGSLYVIDQLLPFDIMRVFYIVNGSQVRGGHRHHKTRQAMICLKGSVDVYMNNGQNEKTISLTSPSQCLIIEPEDWHHMENFSNDSLLLVFASEKFDKGDYITESY